PRSARYPPPLPPPRRPILFRLFHRPESIHAGGVEAVILAYPPGRRRRLEIAHPMALRIAELIPVRQRFLRVGVRLRILQSKGEPQAQPFFSASSGGPVSVVIATKSLFRSPPVNLPKCAASTGQIVPSTSSRVQEAMPRSRVSRISAPLSISRSTLVLVAPWLVWTAERCFRLP